jgi:hypothetical protein
MKDVNFLLKSKISIHSIKKYWKGSGPPGSRLGYGKTTLYQAQFNPVQRGAAAGNRSS